MCDLTGYQKALLRGMIRLRISLHDDLERSVQSLAIEEGPESPALCRASGTMSVIREERAELQAILEALSKPPLARVPAPKQPPPWE